MSNRTRVIYYYIERGLINNINGGDAMFEFRGDILESDADIICHQVNCSGVMKAGLAKQIAQRYPMVEKEYMDLTHPCSMPPSNDYKHILLGTIQNVKISDHQYICNIFGQLGYGRQKICYTDYVAFEKALNELGIFCTELYNNKLLEDEKHSIKPSKITVAFPHGIGCGLANGNWTHISALILHFEAKFKNVATVEIWKKM